MASHARFGKRAEADKSLELKVKPGAWHAYLVELSGAKDMAAAGMVVATTIKKLNALNERCGDELIETGERELLCEFIIRAGALLGYNDEEEDITRQWREW